MTITIGEREDPCSDSTIITVKLYSSIDLGLAVKQDKSYFFAVNNIVITEPVKMYWNCTATNKKITTEKTDSDGIVNFKLNKFALFCYYY
jgi:hypothetical protein